MKKYFLTGLVILLPVALTLMVIFFLFDFFTGPFVPIVSVILAKIEAALHFAIPARITLFISRLLALIFLTIFIFVLGALARWFLLKNLFHLGHLLISRIPIVNGIYKLSRDILSSLFSDDGKKTFKHPVIFPFPCPPSHAICFQAGEVAEECQQKIGIPLVSVFMPTSPHPISGFLFLVPEQDVKRIEMTNEDAVKFLVSCGIIHPGAEKRKTDEIL